MELNPVSKEFKENIKREILNKLYKFIPELANENQTAKQMVEDYIEEHIKYDLQGMGFFVLPTLWSEECKKSNEKTKVQESYS
jgi:6-pyruvoyl-tetrahydropterin synthase